LYPLTLQVKLGAWRLYSIRKADKAFLPFQDKILERDDYTCQFCGFQAREFQEVINIDNNYLNNKPSNMVTACCFCSQCFFLESVGNGSYGGGTLIYLPEISQADLHSLCHVLFCAMQNDAGYKNTAQSIYRGFKFRSQIIEETFGEGTSNPAVLGQLIIDSGTARDACDRLLSDIRLLPSRAKFSAQVEHWATNALDELTSAAG
jgi:intracellular multiplication protein IcmJ